MPPRSSGSHFYRYGTTEHLEWLEPVIVEHKLYIPLASTFNDLRDARPRVEEKTAPEWAAYLQTRLPHANLPADQAAFVGQLDEIVADLGAQKIHEMATSGWHEKTEHHRIYCLSKRWDNLSMWEWYAAKQMGYCLEFARTGIFLDVRDVVYQAPPAYDLTDISNAKSPSWFFYKYPDWSNEEEVRLVLARKQGGPIFDVGPDVLTRVILGEDMINEDVERIRGMALKRTPRVPVATAKWDALHSKFTLVVDS
jgi:hypothetical protein